MYNRYNFTFKIQNGYIVTLNINVDKQFPVTYMVAPTFHFIHVYL